MAERFAFETRLSVTPPYRLDLTVAALRRLPANLVDVWDEERRFYRRVLHDESGHNPIEVQQDTPESLLVRIAGRDAERCVETVARMLGVRLALRAWYRRVKSFPWLARLAREFRGLHPPRYPTLWEACAHAIVFQQISLHAAASIMRRLVTATTTARLYGGAPHHPFPAPSDLLRAPDSTLRGAGLSANKIMHLRAAALAFTDGAIEERSLEALPSAQAALQLRSIRGIGPWSAAVVLLRGLGRLDVFPLNDSGVARSLKLVAGEERVDAEQVLEALGPMRGMLYFHLLLGRLRK